MSFKVKTLEEVLSPTLSKLGIHGNYEVTDAMEGTPRTLIFENSKDQFLYELHGGPELFSQLHNEWGKQILNFYSKSGIQFKK